MTTARPPSGVQPPIRTLRLNMLQAAHELLAAVQGTPVLPIEVLINDHHGLAVAVRSMPGELESAPVAPPILKPMERRLLRIAGLEPLLAKQLAAKAGYRSLSHVYKSLTHLCQLGLLQHTSEGYQLPG